MQFSRPEDGKVAGLQRQITGLVVIDEPEIGVGMIGAVAHIGMGPYAYPLLPPQQQLDIQILLITTSAMMRASGAGKGVRCKVSRLPVIMGFASLGISAVYLCPSMKKDP